MSEDMKNYMLFGRVIVCAITIILSGYLCYESIGGWGWFLIVAAVVCPSPRELN